MGYGPFRVRRILAEPELGDRLDRAVAVLRDEGAVAAYAAMLSGDARIAGLGPAFFTKFLAAAHPEVDAAARPRALVLDRWVARALVDATAAATHEHGSDPWQGALRAWRDPWPPPRYAAYLGWAASAASRAGCTPDEVEISAAAVGRQLLRAAAAVP